jgi:cation:H+ antiporter
VSTPLAVAVFFAGAAASLGSSWFVVSRIERVGSRLGAPEALLGLVSALAADAPEITSSVSALLAHRRAVGAGVVIGSNVFNLAALLGLGSIVAGVITLHRRVVAFQGVIALIVALACTATVAGLLTPASGLGVVLVVLVPYTSLAALDRSRWWLRPNPSALRRWLSRAITEEELELRAVIHPRRGGPRDAAVGGIALLIVVVASVAMEHAAARIGVRLSVPGILVGATVLAAVTSLPNAVAAIYWARRGRGVAMLSTGLNSNALNVAAGYLAPSALLGVGHGSGPETLVAWWYVGLTALVLVLAYGQRGLRRPAGWLIVVCYAAFVAILIALS